MTIDYTFLDAPFFRWSDLASTDKNNPDIVQFKVAGTDTFETKYGVCVNIFQKIADGWNPVKLRIKSKDSMNAKLLRLWLTNIKNGSLKQDVVFKLITWKSASKTSKYPMRDYSLQIL